MKRALFLVFLGLFLCQEGYGQSWRRVGDWGNDFTSIQWVNENLGYISGEKILLKSIDGGLSWVEQKSPDKGVIVDISFFDERQGLLLGAEGQIFRTQNGGESWTSYTHPQNLKWEKIQHLSNDQIVVMGEDGNFIRSSDGGQTWQDGNKVTSADINDFHFVNDTLGFAVTADAELLKTVNAGMDWEVNPTGFEVPLNGVFFTSDSTGYAIGNLGTIIKTVDAGLNWQFINSGIDTDLADVVFHPSLPLTGLISGRNGTMLRTDNGGLTFLASNARTNQDIKTMAFRPGTNNVLAVASSGNLISSNNSGASWAVRLSGRANDYTAIQFTTDLRGYLTGDKGLILLTGNGGNSFVDRSRPISLSFNALYFVSNGAGYVSGVNGNIISSINSGANWTTLNPGTNRDINGLYFFDFNRGFAVGERGLISKTENRGVNWEVVPVGLEQTDFHDILFFNENEGLIIGDNGLVLFSSNVGEDWEQVNLNSTAKLKAIAQLDEGVAIIVGDSGAAFKTSDRGQSWNRIQTGINRNFTDVDFLDESVGFITGDEGLILRTFDAGDSWEMLPTGTFQNFTGVSFGDLNVGYAAGENGIFYQYTCQVPQDIATIFGEDNICLSQQIYSIQDMEEEGTTYEWRVDGGTILEGQGSTRVVVRWDDPGRNAVLVRGQNNCGNGNTTALEVVVSEEPRQAADIQGEGVVCVNTLEEYHVDSIPGTEYFWEATGGVVRSGQGTAKITLEWTNLRDQSLAVSTTNPCGQGPTSEKQIRVITIPEQPSSIQGPDRVGFQQADYEVEALQDVNYQWVIGEGGEIVSGQGTGAIRVAWTNEGDHDLVVTPMNACNQGPSQTLSVNVNLITSLPEGQRPSDIRIFPSPSFGDIDITLEGLSSLIQLEIYNAMGQKIMDIPTREGQFVYAVKDLPKGLHMVILRTRNAEYKRKILVF